MKRVLSSFRSGVLNRRVVTSIGTTALVIVTALLAGAVFRGPSARAAKPIATFETTTSSVETTTTTAAPTGEPNPNPVVLPELGGDELRSGSRGDAVRAYEQRLNDLRFDPGDIDDRFDGATTFAVQTLQKVMGFERTGRIGEQERQALNTFAWPAPLVPTGGARRFEVNIEKQTGTLYVDNKIRLITTVSTGAGNYYCWVPKTGGTRICEYGDTPSGSYNFYTRHNGWQDGDLGRIYNPVYFNGGIAVHGYPQVPTNPASHGCVRIPMYVANYFPDLVELGDPVYVIGGPEGRRPVSYTPIPADAVPAAPPSTGAPSPTTAASTSSTTTSSTTTSTTTTTTTTPST